LSAVEPNNPDGPTLSDLLDEVADGFASWGQAMVAASALLRRHQPDMVVEAADFDAAGAGLNQAGYAARALAPGLRGFLPVTPWQTKDDPPHAGDQQQAGKPSGDTADTVARDAGDAGTPPPPNETAGSDDTDPGDDGDRETGEDHG
jgi:hypothetical protein